MALIKTLPNPYRAGSIDAYLRWSKLEVYPLDRVMRIRFTVYESQESRDAGLSPIPDLEFAYALAGADYDAFVTGISRAADTVGQLVYGYARAQPDLADAQDA